jgi:hypothetical protein
MTTAIGAYATLAGVQARNLNTAAGDAAELQVFCDQVNAWIESVTGRVLAPVPVVKATANTALSIGDTSVPVTLAADIANLAVGDELAIGPVTGTHESSPVQAITSTTITLGVPLANAYGTHAPLERVYLRDGYDSSNGDGSSQGRILLDMRGIVVLTALEIASYTRGAFALIPSTDYWLRPTPNQRDPGYPATEIHMTNIPSPSNPYPAFFPGYGNVRLWGVTGWPAIPTGIVGLAERVVVALWQMKSGGGAYQVAPGSDATEQIPHLLSIDDWKTLKRYTIKTMETV